MRPKTNSLLFSRLPPLPHALRSEAGLGVEPLKASPWTLYSGSPSVQEWLL